MSHIPFPRGEELVRKITKIIKTHKKTDSNRKKESSDQTGICKKGNGE